MVTLLQVIALCISVNHLTKKIFAMKSFFFSLLFALGTLFSVQAQDGLTVIVTNHTSSTWSYKLADSTHGALVNQSFGPGASAEFVINANAYQFPLRWGAQDAGGCYESGSHSEPSAPLSTPFECTGTVLNQAFAAASNGGLYLFVDMK